MQTKKGTPKKTTRSRKEDLLQQSPRLGKNVKELVLGITKGTDVLLLRLRILEMLLNYSKITVKMVYYRLVAVYNYDKDLKFYKRLGYSLKVLRKSLTAL